MDHVCEFIDKEKPERDEDGLLSPFNSIVLLVSHIHWESVTYDETPNLHEIITGRKWTSKEFESTTCALKKLKEIGKKPNPQMNIRDSVFLEISGEKMKMLARPWRYLLKHSGELDVKDSDGCTIKDSDECTII